MSPTITEPRSWKSHLGVLLWKAFDVSLFDHPDLFILHNEKHINSHHDHIKRQKEIIGITIYSTCIDPTVNMQTNKLSDQSLKCVHLKQMHTFLQQLCILPWWGLKIRMEKFVKWWRHILDSNHKALAKRTRKSTQVLDLRFVWPPTCVDLRRLALTLVKYGRKQTHVFTVWPPSASRHKLIASNLSL